VQKLGLNGLLAKIDRFMALRVDDFTNIQGSKTVRISEGAVVESQHFLYSQQGYVVSKRIAGNFCRLLAMAKQQYYQIRGC
jgi:hypothetical protein